MFNVAALLAISLYSFGLFRLWPTDRERDIQSQVSRIALLALACHVYVSHSILFGTTEANLSLVYVLNVISVVMVAVVTVLSFRLPIHNLMLMIFPVSILTTLAALLAPSGSNTTTSDTVITSALLTHILISLAAYSVLMMAACQSILLGIQERNLRSQDKLVQRWLPPLETMESLLVAMLWIGWGLLTLAIAAGFVFLEDMFAQQVSHHIVITSLSWVVYATFLGGRYLFGWRGLTAVRWTLVAFGLLVLGYLGSKFVLEYLIVP